jgi:periplasmic protein CpxP/Spy
MTRKSALTVSAIALAVVAVVAVPFLYAGPGHHRMGGDMGPLAHLARAQKELGLSDAQVDQIKTIVKAARDENAQYRDQLHGGFASVINTLIKNPNDVAAAQAIMDQQNAAERALKTNMLNAASKALNVLTPEQREKLGTMVAAHQARFQRQF